MAFKYSLANCEKMEQSLNELTEHIHTAQSELQKLNNENTELHNENDGLRQQLNVTQDANKALTLQNDEMKQVLEVLVLAQLKNAGEI